ncbi:MAG: hypothetical protein ABSA32_07095 [Candidatus Acidiferrales bacterium]
MTKLLSLLAIAVMAVAISASAKPPDQSFVKFNKSIGPSSVSGGPFPTAQARRDGTFDPWNLESLQTTGFATGYVTLTVKISPDKIIDTSFSEGKVACHLSGEKQPPASIAVPSGVYIEFGGSGRQCSAEYVAVNPIYDQKTRELTGYALSAGLTWEPSDCDVSMHAWVKVRPSLPTDLVVEPQPKPAPSEPLPNPRPNVVQGTSKSQGTAQSPGDMNTVVTKTVVGDEVQLLVSFIAPAPSATVLVPFRQVEVYGFRPAPVAGGLPRLLEPSAFPLFRGIWNPGDRVRIGVVVPKEDSDPSQGWVIRFCIGSPGTACIRSPNLLTASPPPG